MDTAVLGVPSVIVPNERNFFGTGIPAERGGEVAREAAKVMIHRIVTREDPGKPLSDQQVRLHLSKDHGVMMARRTVTKYREALGIGSSSQRRRLG